MFSFSNLLKRDLTISDVAHARQIKNKLFFALAKSQHCTQKRRRKSIKILLQAHEKKF